ncbi:MAG: single-stranded-DNA-specific exonuclease RecJ [Myxococcales bacterium]|nr:single-stranded-DNA-specific exonuclease RecJ [Myxococcales bacterium]
MARRWEIQTPDAAAAEALSREVGVSPMLGALLLARGVDTAEAARRFLSPSLKDLHDPGLMRGMEAAVERLVGALRRQEAVTVWGDYDVDGVTSTSLLKLFLQRIGLVCAYYIPSRMEEGYGLNAEGLRQIAASGTKLLVTVDCGSSDRDEIALARSMGLDVLVIDHHQVPEELPEALALLNPHQPGCGFPAKDLAAVGVAFNLIMALRTRLRQTGLFADCEEPNLREYLDLVALGTLADVVPLSDENRVVAQFGLRELAAGRRPGLAALKEVAGLRGGAVSAAQVVFRLAPRLNAIGRLGKADLAVELLTTSSYSRALALARELDQANSERQAIEQGIFEEALRLAQAELERGDQGGLVLAGEGWHVGVVGIVASRLVDRFGCPVAMIAMQGEEGRGSARGTDDVHLFEALQGCAEHLVAFGGHRAAAGLTVRRERLEAFRRAFLHIIEKQRSGAKGGRALRLDAEVPPGAWSVEAVGEMSALEPHGPGNPEPLFLGANLGVKSARVVGREPPYHLKLLLQAGERTFDAIGFRLGDRLPHVLERMDVAYRPEVNAWEGNLGVQLRLVDFRLPGGG